MKNTGASSSLSSSDVYSTVLFIISLLIAIATLLFIDHIVRERLNFAAVTREAIKESAFEPTVFMIYDRSTKNVCDRLIRVMPFDWWIWACRNELFILNPEGSIKCAAGSTPAVQVFASQFIETCLSVSFDSIVNSYTRLRSKIVPYEIENDTFTVLSALNLLVKEWIAFDANENDVGSRVSARFVEINDAANEKIGHDASRRYKRELSGEEVVRKMASRNDQHSVLIDRMRDIEGARNIKNLRERVAVIGETPLDVGDLKNLTSKNVETITAYQHTREHDANPPMYSRD